MSKLKRRLRRLEKRMPVTEGPSDLIKLVAAHLFDDELLRLERILKRAVEHNGGNLMKQDAYDCNRLFVMALERHKAGWQSDYYSPHMEQWRACDAAKSLSLSRFLRALQDRHPGKRFQMSYDHYWDVLDLAPSEIDELTALVTRASRLSEILPYAIIITRMRIRDNPVAVDEFERLVCGGELP